ncbi:MAG: EAL domain-containing protein [Magnetococcales bacterium]|nr:EAL domain-containing protein [Magnetococcales bacterium]
MAIFVPILLIVTSLVIVLTRINNEIEFTNNEQIGLTQIRQLHESINTMQKIRGLSQIQAQKPDKAVESKLKEQSQKLQNSISQFIEQLNHDQFKVGEMVSNLGKKTKNMGLNLHTYHDKNRLFKEHSALLSQAEDISQEIATRSNLILDPITESHFIMSLVVHRIPTLLESIGAVRGMGSGFLSIDNQSEVDRFRFSEKIEGMRYNLRKIDRSKQIILNSSPHLKPLFSCFIENKKQSAERFLLLSEAILLNQAVGVDANLFFETGTYAIHTISSCYDNLSDELSLLLEKRVNKLDDERTTISLGLTIALLFTIVAFIIFYRKNLTAFNEISISESKNHAILQSAIDGIVTIDERGIIQTANHAVENIFGHAPGTLIGKNIKILMPQPYRDAHDSYLEKYLSTGVKNIIGSIREVEGICPDGGKFPLELSVSELTVDGKTFYTGILHDITERKLAKEALDEAYNELEQRVKNRTSELEEANKQLLLEAEERNKAEQGLILASKVFENASEAILITDHNVNVIDVNNAYINITGFEREDIIGKNPSIGKSGRHDQFFYKSMWKKIIETGQWAGEIWDRNKAGKIYPKWLTINVVKDKHGKTTHYVGIFSDISRTKATEERLEQLAFYDPLTRLPNRMLFQDRLNQEFQGARRSKKQVAVMFIDLDRFKHVNDTLGHAAGDQLLIEISRRLNKCVRQTDTVSRLGGDEFTVILTDITNTKDVAAIANNIILSLQKTVMIDEHKAHVGASIGIAVYPDDGDDFDTITKHADVAMYHAKDSGRGNFKFYKEDMNAKFTNRMKLENEMHAALEDDEFVLHYQPKMDIESGRILSMEALVRWQRSDGTMVPPFNFIPLAEEIGMIIPLGRRILEMACIYNKNLMDTENIHLRVAVNLSPLQFQQVDIQEMVETVLNETGMPAEYLELEVTEGMMMDDSEKATSILNKLRDLKLSISMDDFGTGYSSLSYLKKFPIHTLKIDQSFVRDLTLDSDDSAIVSAIVSMAKSLKLRVVAEGVETPEQMEFLKEIGCHELQGYLISRPIPGDEFTAFIKSDQLVIDKKLKDLKKV